MDFLEPINLLEISWLENCTLPEQREALRQQSRKRLEVGLENQGCNFVIPMEGNNYGRDLGREAYIDWYLTGRYPPLTPEELRSEIRAKGRPTVNLEAVVGWDV